MKKKIYSLLLVLVLVSMFLFISKKIKIAKAECRSQYGPCSEYITKIVNTEVGNSFFSAKKDLGRQLSESSRIEKYNIRFNLPDSLIVEVTEKKAEVALKFAEDRYFLFDKSGNVVAEVQETALPVVDVKDVSNDSDVNYAVKLFIELFKYYDVSSAVLDKFGLTAKVRDANVTFPLEGDVDVLFGSMEVVLLQLNRSRENSTIMGAGNLSSIDLRYKNPVIR